MTDEKPNVLAVIAKSLGLDQLVQVAFQALVLLLIGWALLAYGCNSMHGIRDRIEKRRQLRRDKQQQKIGWEDRHGLCSEEQCYLKRERRRLFPWFKAAEEVAEEFPWWSPLLDFRYDPEEGSPTNTNDDEENDV